MLPRTGEANWRAQLDSTVAAYKAALERQPLAASTRRAYLVKVEQFAGWVSAGQLDVGDPLGDPHARDYAARDYAARDFKAHLKECRQAPRTINQALAALDSFYLHLGLGPPVVSREELPGVSAASAGRR